MQALSAITAPPRPLASAMRDRQVAHAAITRALPDGLGPDPRAAAQCLFHLDESSGRLTVQSIAPLDLSHLGRVERCGPVSASAVGDRLELKVALACQYTPPSDVPAELRPALKADGRCYRSRRVIVPPERRHAWFIARLAARGFAVDPASLTLSPMRRADLGRRGGAIPYVEASCTGTVTDAESLDEAVTRGLGKGRAFGLGLIRLTPLTSEN